MTAQRDPQGRPLVLAQVHNTGGPALDMSGTLTPEQGLVVSFTAGPYPVACGPTLPGQSEPATTTTTSPGVTSNYPELSFDCPPGRGHPRCTASHHVVGAAATVGHRLPDSAHPNGVPGIDG